jgi:hypothetical protein
MEPGRELLAAPRRKNVCERPTVVGDAVNGTARLQGLMKE